MNTSDPYEAIRELDIDGLMIERDMLQTDAYDFLVEEPHLIQYAESLTKQSYTLGELLNELETSDFFQKLTASLPPLARIGQAEKIRYFILGCAEMVAQKQLFPQSTPDGNVRRAIQDQIQELMTGRTVRLIEERAELTPPPTAAETSHVSLNIFIARISQAMLSTIGKNERLLEMMVGDPHAAMLMRRTAQLRQDREIIKETLQAIRDRHKERFIDAASLISNAANILRSNNEPRTEQMLRYLSKCAGEMLADDATRQISGFERGQTHESVILLREYQCQYAAAIRKIIGLTTTDEDED